MFQRQVLIAMVVAGISGAGAFAASVPASDSQFMRKAAEGGLAEVKLGELAKEKASSATVKKFGEHMVSDHSKANEKLKTLAGTKGVTVPDSMNAKDKALYDRLSKLSGAAFDRAYINAMVKDHEEDVAEFRKESQSAKDADVKEFASTTLPTLEDHLRMAKDAASQVSAATSSK